jgi:hypothetical protein
METDRIAVLAPYLARLAPLLALWYETIEYGAGSVEATRARMLSVARHAAQLEPPPALATMHACMLDAMAALNAATHAPRGELGAALSTASVATETFEAALRAALRTLVR